MDRSRGVPNLDTSRTAALALSLKSYSATKPSETRREFAAAEALMVAVAVLLF